MSANICGHTLIEVNIVITAYNLFEWHTKMEKQNRKTIVTHPDDPGALTVVNFDLYPIEVLEASQRALGKNSFNNYALELYAFAIKSKKDGLPVKVSQLSGVELTQVKLDAWFDTVSAKKIKGMNVCETVLMSYVLYHQARIDESNKILDQLSVMLEVHNEE